MMSCIHGLDLLIMSQTDFRQLKVVFPRAHDSPLCERDTISSTTARSGSTSPLLPSARHAKFITQVGTRISTRNNTTEIRCRCSDFCARAALVAQVERGKLMMHSHKPHAHPGTRVQFLYSVHDSNLYMCTAIGNSTNIVLSVTYVSQGNSTSCVQ